MCVLVDTKDRTSLNIAGKVLWTRQHRGKISSSKLLEDRNGEFVRLVLERDRVVDACKASTGLLDCCYDIIYNTRALVVDDLSLISNARDELGSTYLTSSTLLTEVEVVRACGSNDLQPTINSELNSERAD